MEAANKNSSAIRIIFLVVFFVIILLPSAVMVLHIGPAGKLEEKRAMAELPAPEFTNTYARQFSDWFNDHFGLREPLITFNSRVKVGLFRATINSERVMMGKDDWIFYNNSRGEDYIFRSYTHLNLLRKKEMDEYIEEWEARKRSCDRAGIIYIKTFYPQSHTIYPEMLPFMMRIQIRDTISRADQIIRELKKRNSAMPFIDVRAALFDAKKKHILYHKFDTHWNAYGAFIAYRELFNQAYPLLKVHPLPAEDFSIAWTPTKGGDLVHFMGGGVTAIDSVANFTPRTAKARYTERSTEGYPPDSYVTTCDACADTRRVIIFRDSYTENLYKFISPLFKEVIYLKWGYNQEYVDKYKPDIVLETPTERYL